MKFKLSIAPFFLLFGLSTYHLSAYAQPEECSDLTEPATFVSSTGIVCLQQAKITDNGQTFIFKAALKWLGVDQPSQFQLLNVAADPSNTTTINSPSFTAENNTLAVPKIDIPGTYGTERYAVNFTYMQDGDHSLLEIASATIYINPDYIPNETWLPYGMLEPTERHAVNLLARSLPHAKLSSAVYDFDTIAVDNWMLIETSDRGSGMQAGLYQDDVSGDLILAFRGTESCNFPCSLNESKEFTRDLAADVLLAAGQDGDQFDDAVEFAQDIVNRYQDRTIYVTGHSLGGSLAQSIGAKFRLETFAFNSAPVPEEFIEKQQIDPNDETLQQIIHVIADIHDPISNTDENDIYNDADHISPLIQFNFDKKEVLPPRLGSLTDLDSDYHSITTFIEHAASLLAIYKGGW